jgi:hypothetical protein
MAVLGTACEISVSVHKNIAVVSGSYFASTAGHWVTVSVTETTSMPTSWHFVVLLLVRGASAWPVNGTWFSGGYDYVGIVGHDNDTSRTSRGKWLKAWAVPFKHLTYRNQFWISCLQTTVIPFRLPRMRATHGRSLYRRIVIHTIRLEMFWNITETSLKLREDCI